MRLMLLGALAVGLNTIPAGIISPRSVPLMPPPSAATTQDTMTSDFEVSGVKVILRRNTANDVVAVNLYLLGGTQQETESNAGIEPMLLWVSELGTNHYSREALRRKTAELGSTIVVEPDDDWTLFGCRGVRAAFDSTWMIFADRLMTGTTEAADVDLTRDQVLSAVRQRRDSPDDLLH